MNFGEWKRYVQHVYGVSRPDGRPLKEIIVDWSEERDRLIARIVQERLVQYNRDRLNFINTLLVFTSLLNEVLPVRIVDSSKGGKGEAPIVESTYSLRLLDGSNLEQKQIRFYRNEYGAKFYTTLPLDLFAALSDILKDKVEAEMMIREVSQDFMNASRERLERVVL